MLGRSVRTETTAAMRLPAFVSTILVGALAALPQLLWAAPDSPTADRELLSRLATQTGAHTAPPRPSLSEYAATVAQDVFHRLFGWIHFPNINLTGLGPLLQVVGYGLAVLLLAGALILIARFVLASRVRKQGSEGPTGPTASASPVPPAPPSEAAYWWRRFRAAMKRGDSVTAMESLWFWVAVRLTGTAVDPSWTSRELLNQAKRDDLRPAMMQLDGWRFGPSTPTPDALGGLAARLGEVLG
jgi:hypothetical protein